jgi:hypothetical protein
MSAQQVALSLRTLRSALEALLLAPAAALLVCDTNIPVCHNLLQQHELMLATAAALKADNQVLW